MGIIPNIPVFFTNFPRPEAGLMIEAGLMMRLGFNFVSGVVPSDVMISWANSTIFISSMKQTIEKHECKYCTTQSLSSPLPRHLITFEPSYVFRCQLLSILSFTAPPPKKYFTSSDPHHDISIQPGEILCQPDRVR